MKKRILITEPIIDEVIDFLKTDYDVTVGKRGEFSNEQNLIDGLEYIDALLCMLSTPVSKQVLENAPNLKIVANHAVGYDNIDVQAARDLGIKVANTPDVLTESCADFTMGLILSVTRKLVEADQYLREDKFKGWEPLGFVGTELGGRLLGIVGMGRIGQAVARRATSFGMRIGYHNRNRLDMQLEKELNATYYSDLTELIKKTDILSLHCPLTPETRHLIDQNALISMPDHAFLINISRGPVVDEQALAHALHNGTIAGAALDVYEREPIVHPDLLTAPNCILLPHIASATYDTRKAIGLLAANAITSVLQGKADSSIPNLIGP